MLDYSMAAVFFVAGISLQKKEKAVIVINNISLLGTE